MPRYVIQLHQARALHYDFRLEVDGVLRSWAVPKGPSLDPAEKRLAVQVDDHSLSHGDYEGPSVIIWDDGVYSPLTDGAFAEALDGGHASFWLEGSKLRGGWTLHRTSDGAKPQWLLIKRRDEEAAAGVALPPESVKTGRTLLSAVPTTAGAMKAVLTDERFSSPDWIFERKLDGIRCIAIRDGSSLRMLSRNDLSLNERYPGVAEALAGQSRERFVVDGEVVSVSGRFQDDGPRLYHVFDVLWLDGADVRGLPLRERKALLRDALTWEDPLRLVPYRNEEGEAMFAEACANGWEGVIAKRADSVYTAKRSRDWLKFKCEAGQELVIGGFTPPKGSREEFGALLVGVYDDRGLHYAGKVGTGFNRDTLRELASQLRPLARDETPFYDAPRFRDVTWVEPRARRPGRLRRMDPRRPPAPPALPGPADRQGPVQGHPRERLKTKGPHGCGPSAIRRSGKLWSGDINEEVSALWAPSLSDTPFIGAGAGSLMSTR